MVWVLALVVVAYALDAVTDVRGFGMIGLLGLLIFSLISLFAATNGPRR